MVGTADIYKNFYSVISSNLVTDAEVIPADVDDIASFPHIVLNLPSLPKQIETFERYMRNGSIEIEIVAENVQSVSELYDEVENILFDNKSSLTVQSISAGESNVIEIEKGGKHVYSYVLPISFRFKR